MNQIDVLNEVLELFPKPKENRITITDRATAYKLGKDEGYNKALRACIARVNEMKRKVRKSFKKLQR